MKKVRQLKQSVRHIFNELTEAYDLFASPKFIGVSGFRLMKDKDILKSKLNRLKSEIEQPDEYSDGAFELFDQVSKVFHDSFTSEDVRVGAWEEKTFPEVLEAVEWAFNKTRAKYPEDQQVQKMRAPFDILKHWYGEQDPKFHEYIERTTRRYSCHPLYTLRKTILPLKAVGALTVKEIESRGGVIVRPGDLNDLRF